MFVSRRWVRFAERIQTRGSVLVVLGIACCLWLRLGVAAWECGKNGPIRMNGPELQATLVDSHGPRAVVDGQAVQCGDRIEWNGESWRVDRIETGRVGLGALGTGRLLFVTMGSP